MENVFLSIIIPSYNPDFDEFRRCINSVNNFSFPYEIVVVDDGSHYEIAAECENYIKKYEHAFFIRNEHGGVSSARNLGIEQCCGKYVFFLDVDDEISHELVAYLNCNYTKLVADWILCGFLVKTAKKNTVRIKV